MGVSLYDTSSLMEWELWGAGCPLLVRLPGVRGGSVFIPHLLPGGAGAMGCWVSSLLNPAQTLQGIYLQLTQGVYPQRDGNLSIGLNG